MSRENGEALSLGGPADYPAEGPERSHGLDELSGVRRFDRPSLTSRFDFNAAASDFEPKSSSSAI
jgi:hypothetical protein